MSGFFVAKTVGWRRKRSFPGRACSSCSRLARIRANLEQEEHALPGKLRFLLQPTVFATKKPLTARERAIRDDPGNSVARDYFERAYAAIRAVPGVRDATDAFDGASEDVFLDTAHCADRGNELLARPIAALVR